jgi:hypothetical protein
VAEARKILIKRIMEKELLNGNICELTENEMDAITDRTLGFSGADMF